MRPFVLSFLASAQSVQKPLALVMSCSGLLLMSKAKVSQPALRQILDICAEAPKRSMIPYFSALFGPLRKALISLLCFSASNQSCSWHCV